MLETLCTSSPVHDSANIGEISVLPTISIASLNRFRMDVERHAPILKISPKIH